MATVSQVSNSDPQVMFLNLFECMLHIQSRKGFRSSAKSVYNSLPSVFCLAKRLHGPMRLATSTVMAVSGTVVCKDHTIKGNFSHLTTDSGVFVATI